MVKYINQSNKFHAHDEKNEINEGDVVQITEHKPISKSKSWVVTKVFQKRKIKLNSSEVELFRK